MELKKLLEERAKLAAEIHALADSQATWTAEDRQNWNELNSDYDKFSAQIEAEEGRIKVAQRAADIAGEQEKRAAASHAIAMATSDSFGGAQKSAAAPTEEHRALAQQAWFRRQMEMPLDERHEEACRLTGMNPNNRELCIRSLDTPQFNRIREKRAGMSTQDAVGGYTIPEGFVNNFEIALLAFGGIRQAADVIRTATGNNLPWPTANDTATKGALLTEETTIGATANPTVGVKTFGAYKMSSKLIQVSPELLQDSAFDMAAQIGSWLGERIGRIESDYYTTGTGSSEPTGILASSGGAYLGVTFASTTAITSDELLDLIHSVDPAYRQGSSFMAHDTIIKYFRKMKTGTGEYIWQDGMRAGQGQTLFGYPVITNQSMTATMTATDKNLIFGNLKKFKIRDVAEIRLRRLVERYADTDQEGFVAFHRTDSGLLDAGTYPVKYAKQAAS